VNQDGSVGEETDFASMRQIVGQEKLFCDNQSDFTLLE
jgi:hypothetical protein